MIVVCAALGCAVSACASTETCYEAGTPPNQLRTIYVVQRGWHTGVAVPTAEWSFLSEFPNIEHLELGWGDERFYQAEETTLWMGIRAALWPTPSTIHAIGLAAVTPHDAWADAVVPVRVSVSGLRAMTRGIEQEFSEDEPVASGPEISTAPAPNRFYRAKRSFYFPRMCNWWIARRLEDAGCPIRPWTILTASQVIHAAHRFRGEPHE
jgi:hypothetical protein